MSPEVAVQDAHPVPGPKGVGGAHRYRLLAATVVERSRHLALLVEGEAALLGGAHHLHEAQQASPVLARELHPTRIELGILDRAHLAERHMSRPFGSGLASGSPRPGRLSRRRDLRAAAPMDAGAEGSSPSPYVRIATAILPWTAVVATIRPSGQPRIGPQPAGIQRVVEYGWRTGRSLSPKPLGGEWDESRIHTGSLPAACAASRGGGAAHTGRRARPDGARCLHRTGGRARRSRRSLAYQNG